MQEYVAKLKRQAQKEFDNQKTFFTKQVENSYASALLFHSLENIVACEFVCSELAEIQGETDEQLAKSIESYKIRAASKLTLLDPVNEVEVLRYKAMRNVLDRLQYMP